MNDSKNKVDNLTEVLHYHSFLSYTEDETTYIQKFEELIEEYAILEGLLIDIIPYQTIEERIVIEKGFNQKFKIRRWLSKELTYFHPKENFFLHPIFIHDKKYVIKGFSTSDKRVNETDVQAINLLFIIYSLMVEMVPKEEDSNDKN